MNGGFVFLHFSSNVQILRSKDVDGAVALPAVDDSSSRTSTG
jgi:hypothetical protein